MLNYSQGKRVSKAPVRTEIQTHWDSSGANTESGRATPSKLISKPPSSLEQPPVKLRVQQEGLIKNSLVTGGP